MPSQYYRPLGLLSGEAARMAVATSLAQPLVGGPLAFSLVERCERQDPGSSATRQILPISALTPESLAPFLEPRNRFAGFDLTQRPLIMGIVNVTPDSFSDGGDHADPRQAIRHGLDLWEQGADILDVGGESTRPGAKPVDIETEATRVLPVIAALSRAGAVVSVDTRHAAIMDRAIDEGAKIINDVSALTHDPDSIGLVARRRVPAILMHMRGDPVTMQDDPQYQDVVLDVYDALSIRVAACRAAGIPLGDILVDPGIGFGKTVSDNCRIIGDIALYHGLGCGILLGASRKSFIARLSQGEPPKDRLAGSLAAMLAALDQGVRMVRVHDVAAAAQAIKIWQSLH